MINAEETRKMSPYDLRNLCLKKNWHTNGINEDYDALLSYADELPNVMASRYGRKYQI